MSSKKKNLPPKAAEQLLGALKARFEKNKNRHEGLRWTQVLARLQASPEKLWPLNEMERTGGEPDVVGQDKKTGEYLFYDCSAESPKAAEASATTVKRWSRESNTSRRTMCSTWLPPWASSC